MAQKSVSLFVTCLVDQFYPEVGEATVRLLRHLGVEVDFPADQTCCGQVALNGGFRSHAVAVARRFVEVFRGQRGDRRAVGLVRGHHPHALRRIAAWLPGAG